jgi:hypothetical protein
MSFLNNKRNCLFKREKISEELKKILGLERDKVEKLDQELDQSKETTCSLKSSIGALQGQHDVLLKTHQDSFRNLMFFGQAPLKH